LKNSTLQILDGLNSSSGVLESFSGKSEYEQTVFSSGCHLSVGLKTLQEKDVEFIIMFEAVKKSAVGPCLGRKGNVIELSNAKGRIFTPLFPRNFPHGVNCTWLITAPKGHFVKLNMKSFDKDYRCQYSSLYIRDGKSASSKLLKKCGEEFEPSVISSGRYLLVQFYSLKFKYNYSNGSGFEAVFEALKHSPAPNSCKAHSRDIILRKYHGMLASYNYPFPYDEYGPTKCSWRFKTHPGYKIKLSFDRFDLPDSKDCSDDYVEVNRQRFCGSKKPSTVTLHDDRLTFRSSGKKRFSGFKATYTAERTTAAKLEMLGICVPSMVALLIVTYLCYKIVRGIGEDEDKEDDGNTLETEWF